MKRLWLGISTGLVVVPTGLLALLVWFNWGDVQTATENGQAVLKVFVGGRRELHATVGELVLSIFVAGVAIGILATLCSLSGQRRAWLARLEELAAANRKLAAANRALEAALPVLREQYDTAIGAYDPAADVLDTPAVEPDDLDTADVRQLALEDAEARRQAGRTRP